MRSAVLKDRFEKFLTGLRIGTTEIGRAALDFVYPPACFLCGGDVPTLCFAHFCEGCQQALAPVILDSCKRCGAPVGPFLETTLGCIHCRTTPFHFDKLVRLGVYENLLKRACLTIKKPGTEPLAQALGEMLWSREGERLQAAKVDRVLCVPHHWTRRIVRGQNPSETLARLFAKRLHATMDAHRVVKTRRTPKQTHLPATRRKANLRDAFRLRRPRKIQDQNILLVDDVLTTGTTVNRIARLLRKAGVKTITVAVLARTLSGSH